MGSFVYQILFFLVYLSVEFSEEVSLNSDSSYKHNNNHNNNCGKHFYANKKLKFVFGDALNDRTDCIGPHGIPYPKREIENMIKDIDLKRFKISSMGSRQAKMMSEFVNDKSSSIEATRKSLLSSYQRVNSLDSFEEALHRYKRDAKEEKKKMDQDDMDMKKDVTCKSDNLTPSRLCKTIFNTTAPMYGVSLTSGKPVTIVQKFPDLLQQVVYETCSKADCDLIHGECVQTYTPYLFLVIPLGPVTLTGQDYVLVESGCSCRPKYSGQTDPDPSSVIPNFS